jgi:hypothetical protein
MQEALVFLIVLAAVAFLVRQWWPSKDKDAGCHSCAFHRPGGVAKAPEAKGSTPSGADGLIQINTKGINGAGQRPTLPAHLQRK